MNPHTFPSRVGRRNPLASSMDSNWHSTNHTHTNLRVLFFNATFLTPPSQDSTTTKACIYMYSTSICCSYSNPVPSLVIQQLNSVPGEERCSVPRGSPQNTIPRRKNSPNNVKYFWTFQDFFFHTKAKKYTNIQRIVVIYAFHVTSWMWKWIWFLILDTP